MKNLTDADGLVTRVFDVAFIIVAFKRIVVPSSNSVGETVDDTASGVAMVFTIRLYNAPVSMLLTHYDLSLRRYHSTAETRTPAKIT
jgi:hypothetical protein